MLYYIVLIVMTVIGALAGYHLKKASSSKGLMNLLLNNNFYIGGLLYFLSALMNIYILQYLDYSVVLPLTSITYIWTLLISFSFLKEKISLKKIVGLSVIIIGAIFIVM